MSVNLPEKVETFEQAASWANVALQGVNAALDADRPDIAEEALELFDAYFGLAWDFYHKKPVQ